MAVPVPAGEAFTPAQSSDIAKAIMQAERASGFVFSVYVGAADTDARSFAERLHGELSDSARSVLVMVDPVGRQLEVVTGSVVRRTLTNRQSALAAITMQAAFATGDLVRGIQGGLQQLAANARAPQLLHTDTP